MFKRVSSMVLAVVMLLTMACSMMTVSAAEAVKINVTVDKAEAERNNTVTFTYYVEGMDSWGSLKIQSAYNPALMTLNSVTSSTGNALDYNDVSGAVTLAVINNNTSNLVAVLKFTVNAGATLDTTASVSAKVVEAADQNFQWQTMAGTASTASVSIVCKHGNAGATPNGANKHTVQGCVNCGNKVENCNFITYVKTVTNVPHGQQTYTVWKCARCTNTTTKGTGTVVPHDSAKVVSRGNYNSAKTHDLVCSVDGTFQKTEACTFTDKTGCQFTCDKCKAVYNNPNMLTAAHKNLNEHYYAPTTGALGKITELCTACNTTVKTTSEAAKGAWAFADVPNDWYHGAITFNRAYGLFNGTSATTFEPDVTITRGQAATVLSRMLVAAINEATNQNITEDSLKNMSQTTINTLADSLVARYGVKKADKVPTFTDVPAGEYYNGHIRLMATLGIVNGTSDTTFEPDKNIIREELAALMSRMVGVLEKINGETYTSFGTAVGAYSDKAKVSDWATANVEWVRKTGLMKGDENNAFNPGATATRAEVAMMMFRVKRTVDHITVHNVPANQM